MIALVIVVLMLLWLGGAVAVDINNDEGPMYCCFWGLALLFIVVGVAFLFSIQHESKWLKAREAQERAKVRYEALHSAAPPAPEGER